MRGTSIWSSSGPFKLSLVAVAALLPTTLPLWDGGRAVLHWCRMQLAAFVPFGAEAANWLWQGPLLLLLSGLVLAAADRAIAAWQLRRFLETGWRPVRPGDRLYDVVRELGLEGAVRLFARASGSPVFTAHVWRPRVYVSATMNAKAPLTRGELRAVLRHEAAHLRRLDPLRLAAMRFLRRILFWIPALAPHEERYRWRLEALADEAARVEGDMTLAAAIVKVARGSGPVPEPLASLPSFYQPSTVEWRVRRLLGQAARVPVPGPGRLRLALSTVAVILVWTSVLMGAAPHEVHPDHSPSLPASSGSYCSM